MTNFDRGTAYGTYECDGVSYSWALGSGQTIDLCADPGSVKCNYGGCRGLRVQVISLCETCGLGGDFGER
jgi:hypothetical protein